MPILRLTPEMMIGELPEHNEESIRGGVGGNYDTVKVMKRVARERAGHPLVRQLAAQIVMSRGIPSMHYLDESKVIGEYVWSKVRYLRDPLEHEYLQDPLKMITDIQNGRAQGDCDDMALLVATLLLSIGHRPLFRVVRYKGYLGPYNHIYVVDYETNPGEKSKRIVLDAIVKARPIGFEVPHVSGEELEIVE